MASINSLIDKYKQKLSSGLSQMENTLSSIVQDKPIYYDPNSLSGKAVNTLQKFSDTISRPFKTYGEEQIARPLAEGALQAHYGKGVLQKSMGVARGFGGAFSATPVGIASNLLTGVATGISKQARGTGGLTDAYKAALTPTSFATEGLGINNPLLAMGVDVLTSGGDPRSIKGFTKVGKGLFGSSDEIAHNLRDLDAAMDVLRTRKVSPEAREQALDAIKILSERHLTKDLRQKWLNQPLKLGKAIEKELTSARPQVYDTVLGFAEQSKTSRQTGRIKPGSVQSASQVAEELAVPPANLEKPGVSSISSLADDSKVSIGSTSQYNIGKLKTKDTKIIREAIDKVKPAFEKAVGGPITHGQVLKSANEFSEDVIKTIGRATTEKLSAAQLRLRQNIASLADRETVTPELLDALRTDATFARSTAQLLGQRGIEALPQTPAGKLKLQYLRAVNEVSDDIDGILAAAKGVDFTNPEQAANFYRQFVKPKMGDWVDKVRYSSMLSSPNTWINNFSSNYQGTGLVAPVEKTITGAIDWLASAFNPKRERQSFVGEGVEYAKGYYSNLGNAAKNFWDTLTGRAISSTQEMFNTPLTKKGTVGRVAEDVLSFPSKVLQATDEFFSTLAEGGSTKALEYRVSKGGKVADIAVQAGAEAKKRLFNAPFGLPEEGPVLKAIEFVPQKVAEARNSANPVLSTLAKFTFPFVRIPSNILKASVEYSPAGLITIPGATNKTEQLAKAIMGSGMALGAGMLASSGRLTFAEPKGEKQKNEFRAAGLQPYAIKVGDKWFSYSKFHPVVAFNLALAAAWKDAKDNQTMSESDLEAALTTGAKWLGFFADQSYVKNMGDLVAGLKGDSFSFSKLAANYPQQLIPYRALMGWVTRLFDPYQRTLDPEGSALDKQMQLLMMQIPGLSQTLPTRVDSKGNPVENQNRVINSFSPVGRVTTENPEAKGRYEKLRQESIQGKNEDAARSKVKQSGLPETYKNKTFYKDGDTVQSFEIPQEIQLTGKSLIDKELKSQYSSATEDVIKGVFTMFNTGQITKAQAEELLLKVKPSRAINFEAEAKRQKAAQEKSALNKQRRELLKGISEGTVSPAAAAPELSRISTQINILNGSARVRPVKVAKLSLGRSGSGRGGRSTKVKIKKIRVPKPKSIRRLKAKKVRRLSV